MPKKLPVKSLIGVVLLALVGVAGWSSWTWWQWAIAPAAVSAPNTPPRSANLRVAPGTSAQAIGQDLETLGLIRSAQAWNLWARWLLLQNTNGGFQAGTYQISATQTLPDIAQQIWTGAVAETPFTIPEGWSIREMATYFEQQGYFTAEEFLTAVNTFSTAEYPWLPTTKPIEGYPRLEGYLFPDTYQLPLDTSIQPTTIIRLMLNRFEQVALPIYQRLAGKSKLTLAEFITLASIVEREAVVPTERSRIAGVFYNRLRQSMPLGSDPTVEYAFGIKQTPDRPLTFAQVEQPSPYNTYVTPGLPPAPIASPGKLSLEATANPENTDYLYFVARYDGTHVFSRTLQEHQAAQTTIHDQRDAAQKNAQ
mgnify:FL=1